MIRLVLVFLIISLIVRAFIIAGMESRKENPLNNPDRKPWKFKKGVPKGIGEYIEFEEIEKKR